MTCKLARILAVASLVLVASTHCGPSASKPPNILLIVSEDNGPELGSYGFPYARTPHLDGLADEGVRFERAFVPQAGCSQSRAALLTGLYPHQNGQIGLATWRHGLFREDTPNLVTWLRDAGYRTGIIGKLHINPASAFPFDYSSIPSANFQRKDIGAYATNAGEFMRDSDAPFFLSVNYPDAHRPFLVQVDGLPQEVVSESEVEPLAYMGLDSPVLRKDTANYANSLNRLDSLVGDLLSELEASGKQDDTIVVYLGDHGADLLRGKRTSYEGGLRVPLIVRWPGVSQASQVREELVSTLDLAPTLLEAAGTAAIPNLPGLSLTPLLQGEDPEWRSLLFTEYHVHSNHNYFPQRTVRSDRYKLIQNLMPNVVNPGYDFTVDKFIGAKEMAQALREAPDHVRNAYELMRQPPQWELYDLESDPYEFRNVAEDEGHAAVLGAMQDALMAWRAETNDPFLDSDNVQFVLSEIDATRLEDGAYDRSYEWTYRDRM